MRKSTTLATTSVWNGVSVSHHRVTQFQSKWFPSQHIAELPPTLFTNTNPFNFAARPNCERRCTMKSPLPDSHHVSSSNSFHHYLSVYPVCKVFDRNQWPENTMACAIVFSYVHSTRYELSRWPAPPLYLCLVCVANSIRRRRPRAFDGRRPAPPPPPQKKTGSICTPAFLYVCVHIRRKPFRFDFPWAWNRWAESRDKCMHREWVRSGTGKQGKWMRAGGWSWRRRVTERCCCVI